MNRQKHPVPTREIYCPPDFALSHSDTFASVFSVLFYFSHLTRSVWNPQWRITENNTEAKKERERRKNDW